MTPNRRRIDDRQLDEALRTIAAGSAPLDLPARVLDAMQGPAPSLWWPAWGPGLAAVAVAVVALAAIVVWSLAPARPGHIVVSRMDPAPHPTSAHSAPTHPRTDAPREAQGAGRMAQGTETSHVRTSAPGHAPTGAPPAPREAQGARLMAQGVEQLPALDPPAPLAISSIDTPELSERQLQVNALHVPALDVETLEH